jgi:hypothetical protein
MGHGSGLTGKSNLRRKVFDRMVTQSFEMKDILMVPFAAGVLRDSQQI